MKTILDSRYDNIVKEDIDKEHELNPSYFSGLEGFNFSLWDLPREILYAESLDPLRQALYFAGIPLAASMGIKAIRSRVAKTRQTVYSQYQAFQKASYANTITTKPEPIDRLDDILRNLAEQEKEEGPYTKLYKEVKEAGIDTSKRYKLHQNRVKRLLDAYDLEERIRQQDLRNSYGKPLSRSDLEKIITESTSEVQERIEQIQREFKHTDPYTRASTLTIHDIKDPYNKRILELLHKRITNKGGDVDLQNITRKTNGDLSVKIVVKGKEVELNLPNIVEAHNADPFKETSAFSAYPKIESSKPYVKVGKYESSNRIASLPAHVIDPNTKRLYTGPAYLYEQIDKRLTYLLNFNSSATSIADSIKKVFHEVVSESTETTGSGTESSLARVEIISEAEESFAKEYKRGFTKSYNSTPAKMSRPENFAVVVEDLMKGTYFLDSRLSKMADDEELFRQLGLPFNENDSVAKRKAILNNLLLQEKETEASRIVKKRYEQVDSDTPSTLKGSQIITTRGTSAQQAANYKFVSKFGIDHPSVNPFAPAGAPVDKGDVGLLLSWDKRKDPKVFQYPALRELRGISEVHFDVNDLLKIKKIHGDIYKQFRDLIKTMRTRTRAFYRKSGNLSYDIPKLLEVIGQTTTYIENRYKETGEQMPKEIVNLQENLKRFYKDLESQQQKGISYIKFSDDRKRPGFSIGLEKISPVEQKRMMLSQNYEDYHRNAQVNRMPARTIETVAIVDDQLAQLYDAVDDSVVKITAKNKSKRRQVADQSLREIRNTFKIHLIRDEKGEIVTVGVDVRGNVEYHQKGSKSFRRLSTFLKGLAQREENLKKPAEFIPYKTSLAGVKIEGVTLYRDKAHISNALNTIDQPIQEIKIEANQILENQDYLKLKKAPQVGAKGIIKPYKVSTNKVMDDFTLMTMDAETKAKRLGPTTQVLFNKVLNEFIQAKEGSILPKSGDLSIASKKFINYATKVLIAMNGYIDSKSEIFKGSGIEDLLEQYEGKHVSQIENKKVRRIIQSKLRQYYTEKFVRKEFQLKFQFKAAPNSPHDAIWRIALVGGDGIDVSQEFINPNTQIDIQKLSKESRKIAEVFEELQNLPDHPMTDQTKKIANRLLIAEDFLNDLLGKEKQPTPTTNKRVKKKLRLIRKIQSHRKRDIHRTLAAAGSAALLYSDHNVIMVGESMASTMDIYYKKGTLDSRTLNMNLLTMSLLHNSEAAPLLPSLQRQMGEGQRFAITELNWIHQFIDGVRNGRRGIKEDGSDNVKPVNSLFKKYLQSRKESPLDIDYDHVLAVAEGRAELSFNSLKDFIDTTVKLASEADYDNQDQIDAVKYLASQVEDHKDVKVKVGIESIQTANAEKIFSQIYKEFKASSTKGKGGVTINFRLNDWLESQGFGDYTHMFPDEIALRRTEMEDFSHINKEIIHNETGAKQSVSMLKTNSYARFASEVHDILSGLQYLKKVKEKNGSSPASDVADRMAQGLLKRLENTIHYQFEYSVSKAGMKREDIHNRLFRGKVAGTFTTGVSEIIPSYVGTSNIKYNIRQYLQKGDTGRLIGPNSIVMSGQTMMDLMFKDKAQQRLAEKLYKTNIVLNAVKAAEKLLKKKLDLSEQLDYMTLMLEIERLVEPYAKALDSEYYIRKNRSIERLSYEFMNAAKSLLGVKYITTNNKFNDELILLRKHFEVGLAKVQNAMKKGVEVLGTMRPPGHISIDFRYAGVTIDPLMDQGKILVPATLIRDQFGDQDGDLRQVFGKALGDLIGQTKGETMTLAFEELHAKYSYMMNNAYYVPNSIANPKKHKVKNRDNYLKPLSYTAQEHLKLIEEDGRYTHIQFRSLEEQMKKEIQKLANTYGFSKEETKVFEKTFLEQSFFKRIKGMKSTLLFLSDASDSKFKSERRVAGRLFEFEIGKHKDGRLSLRGVVGTSDILYVDNVYQTINEDAKRKKKEFHKRAKEYRNTLDNSLAQLDPETRQGVAKERLNLSTIVSQQKTAAPEPYKAVLVHQKTLDFISDYIYHNDDFNDALLKGFNDSEFLKFVDKTPESLMKYHAKESIRSFGKILKPIAEQLALQTKHGAPDVVSSFISQLEETISKIRTVGSVKFNKKDDYYSLLTGELTEDSKRRINELFDLQNVRANQSPEDRLVFGSIQTDGTLTLKDHIKAFDRRVNRMNEFLYTLSNTKYPQNQNTDKPLDGLYINDKDHVRKLEKVLEGKDIDSEIHKALNRLEDKYGQNDLGVLEMRRAMEFLRNSESKERYTAKQKAQQLVAFMDNALEMRGSINRFLGQMVSDHKGNEMLIRMLSAAKRTETINNRTRALSQAVGALQNPNENNLIAAIESIKGFDRAAEDLKMHPDEISRMNIAMDLQKSKDNMAIWDNIVPVNKRSDTMMTVKGLKELGKATLVGTFIAVGMNTLLTGEVLPGFGEKQEGLGGNYWEKRRTKTMENQLKPGPPKVEVVNPRTQDRLSFDQEVLRRKFQNSGSNFKNNRNYNQESLPVSVRIS